MLITLVQQSSVGTSPLIVGMDEDRAREVIHALQLQGWRVISKVYETPSEAADSLQVALLEASALPKGAPLRIAVERAAAAAMLHTPAADQCLHDRARFTRSLAAVPAGRHRPSR